MPKARKFTEKSALLRSSIYNEELTSQFEDTKPVINKNYSLLQLPGLFHYLAENPDKEVYLCIRTLNSLGKLYVECLNQYQKERELPVFLITPSKLFPQIPDEIKEKFSEELKNRIINWEKLQLEIGKSVFPKKLSYQEIDKRIQKVKSSEKRKKCSNTIKVWLLVLIALPSVGLFMSSLLMLMSSNFGDLKYAKHQHEYINTTSPLNSTYITTTTDSSSLVPVNPERYAYLEKLFSGTKLSVIGFSSILVPWIIILLILKYGCANAPEASARRLNNMLEKNLEDPVEDQIQVELKNRNGTWGLTRFSQFFKENNSGIVSSADIEMENAGDVDLLSESSELAFEV